MANNTVKNTDKLSKANIIAYGCGGIATTLAATFRTSFTMKFMTDIAGISAALIGTIMMLITIFDAINDPIIGGMADRCNTKYGKYRPFMMVGVVILAISLVMQHTVPNFSATGLLIYYVIGMIVYSIGMTAAAVPWQALNSVMTTDSEQRNLLLAMRQFLGFTAAGLAGVFTLGLIEKFGGGKAGWMSVSIIYGAVCILTMFIAAQGAKKKDYKDSIPTPPKTTLSNIFKTTLSNKAIVCVATVFGIYSLGSSVVGAANLYYFDYVVGNIGLYSMVSFVMLITNFLIIPLMPFLLRKLGKVGCVVLGFGIFLIRSFVVVFAGAALSQPMVFGLSSITNIGGVIANFAILSMIPDCIDYSEYTTGVASAGLVNSSITFMQKFGMSFSTMIVGVILSLCGYVAGAQVTAEITSGILFTVTWIPIAMSLIAMAIIVKVYPINRAFGQKMREELVERRAK